MRSSIGIVVLLSALFFAASTTAARTVRIALPGYNITQIVFFAAKEKGFYKEEGLDVDLIQMTGTLANLALMSGEVSFSSVPAAAMSEIPAAVTRSFSVPTSADKITARVRIRALPAEVLADLVTNAKLDPAVVANMPTFTLGKTVVEWTSATGFGCVP